MMEIDDILRDLYVYIDDMENYMDVNGHYYKFSYDLLEMIRNDITIFASQPKKHRNMDYIVATFQSTCDFMGDILPLMRQDILDYELIQTLMCHIEMTIVFLAKAANNDKKK